MARKRHKNCYTVIVIDQNGNYSCIFCHYSLINKLLITSSVYRQIEYLNLAMSFNWTGRRVDYDRRTKSEYYWRLPWMYADRPTHIRLTSQFNAQVFCYVRIKLRANIWSASSQVFQLLVWKMYHVECDVRLKNCYHSSRLYYSCSHEKCSA